MGIYSVKPKFQKLLTPILNLFIKLKIHPTIINIKALLLSIVAGFALYYADKSFYWLILVPIIAFVRTALNALDGLVARKLKVKNQEYGEVLNEFFDRISDVAIFYGLALASYTNLVLGSAVVILILLNSYLSIVSKAAGGKRQYGGIMGKADRMAYLGIAAIIVLFTKNFQIFSYLLIFVGVGMIVTIMQRFMQITKELHK